MIIYAVFGVFMLLSWLVGNQLKQKFKEYSKIPLKSGLTGKEVAEKMLREHGITDVTVISVRGELTDHYDPIKKTINLSENVFNGNHISAAAVASHECGHAVQHKTAYAFLNVRSALVPIVNISTQWVHWVLLAGIALVNVLPQILMLGIIIFAITTLFSMITLPVEYDASARALKWLEKSGLVLGDDHAKTKNALEWAASTYIVAALASLATLIYYIMILRGRKD